MQDGGVRQPSACDAHYATPPIRGLGENMEQPACVLYDEGRKSELVRGDRGYLAHERTLT